MTTPFWCLLLACIMPVPLVWITAWYRQKELGKIDNKYPRIQYAQLGPGVGARLVAAQQNCWEALAVFAPAVLVAHLSGADADKTAAAAILWVIARLVFILMYAINKDALRSLSFVVSLGTSLYIFYLAAVAA